MIPAHDHPDRSRSYEKRPQCAASPNDELVNSSVTPHQVERLLDALRSSNAA
jgi:hypothetical protein